MEPKKILVSFPVRWQSKGGIPKQLDRRVWKQNVPLMLKEFPSHPDMAHKAKRIVDGLIYRLLSNGARG